MVKPVKEVLSEKSKGEKPSLNKNIAGQKKITSKESRTGWWSRKKQDNEN